MFCRIRSGTVYGLKPYVIDVEVDINSGLPCFVMVGSLKSEVKESAERVRTALKNADFSMPPARISVNLSPADITKSGTGFDLAIALALLSDIGKISSSSLDKIMALGELGLDGSIRGICGVMPMVFEASKNNIKYALVPEDNLGEARLVDGVISFGIKTLKDAVDAVNDIDKGVYKNADQSPETDEQEPEDNKITYDFIDVTGQESLKRGVIIAAAGFHHMLIMGAPGTGKTMIARRIPSILPPLSGEECMDVSSIYSIAGKLSPGHPLITKRPFLSPHHGITPSALTGGGKIPTPGILSLANKGVLFLDELPEFDRRTIEMLREPLEEKKISIVRVGGNFSYPADIMLVGAMNPCPCGYFPDINRCRCSGDAVRRYQSRISGPILDRIDICMVAEKVKIKDLQGSKGNMSSAVMRKKVMEARHMQNERYEGTGYGFNSRLDIKGIEKYCTLEAHEKKFAEKICKNLDISARGYHKLLRIARTVADLDLSEKIREEHLAEAVFYRPQLPGG